MTAGRLVWTPALSVGHRGLDQDHRDLFALVNRFVGSPDLAAARRALIEVDSYARGHFSREEEVMRLAGFDGLAEHRVLHARLLGDIKRLLLTDLVEDARRPPAAAIRAVAALLDAWMFDHVMVEDLKMRVAVAELARRIVAQRAGS